MWEVIDSKRQQHPADQGGRADYQLVRCADTGIYAMQGWLGEIRTVDQRWVRARFAAPYVIEYPGQRSDTAEALRGVLGKLRGKHGGVRVIWRGRVAYEGGVCEIRDLIHRQLRAGLIAPPAGE